MEIVKLGVIPENIMYQGVCSRCKCIVRFKQREGTVTSDQRDGDYVSILCPTEGCGARITGCKTL